MKSQACLLIAFSWLTTFSLQCAAESPNASFAAVVPDSLKVPLTESVLIAVKAKGTQNYEARAKKDDPTKFEWVFKGPSAELLDEQGKTIGKHYAGPTWEWSDGSKVVGELKGKADASKADAVPWLLLAAKAHEGSGQLTDVTYIQRVNTTGGKAPAQCDEKSAGKQISVPYTAVYLFYTHKP